MATYKLESIQLDTNIPKLLYNIVKSYIHDEHNKIGKLHLHKNVQVLRVHLSIKTSYSCLQSKLLNHFFCTQHKLITFSFYF